MKVANSSAIHASGPILAFNNEVWRQELKRALSAIIEEEQVEFHRVGTGREIALQDPNSRQLTKSPPNDIFECSTYLFFNRCCITLSETRRDLPMWESH
jgi:hypothetical protein